MRELSPTVAWLELVRGSAMDRFEQLGFPSVRDEEWKYTNLASLAKENFTPAISDEINIAGRRAFFISGNSSRTSRVGEWFLA